MKQENKEKPFQMTRIREREREREKKARFFMARFCKEKGWTLVLELERNLRDG